MKWPRDIAIQVGIAGMRLFDAGRWCGRNARSGLGETVRIGDLSECLTECIAVIRDRIAQCNEEYVTLARPPV